MLTRVAAVVSTVAFFAIRWPHARLAHKLPVRLSLEDGLERALKGLVGLGVVMPALWALCPQCFGGEEAQTPWRLALGCAVLCAGHALFWATHAQLGRNYSASLEVRSEHALVVDGVYAVVRHPMYAAFFLHALGSAVLVPAPVVGAVYVAAIAALCALRLQREEQMMADAFGDQYAQYCKRTARLLPYVF